MKSYLFFLLQFLTISVLQAQNGKITGKVINASSGQPLSGATLLLVEKNKSVASDLNGVFSFSKLDTGSYSVKCSYTGYEPKIIEEIVVKNNDNTDVSISLSVKSSDAVVVTSTRRLKAAGATVESLLIAQKNSASVSDGISEQSIKKTPDKSSSDVIKRVSGASIQDDKFAVIRGLNDRYNAAFINGAPLPSTESDRKAFAFDIFPSAILENLIIYKTSTPDKSGEFAGGIIDITTKSTSAKNIGAFTIAQGYNSQITGKNRMYNEMKGKYDWIGLDDGSRALPDGIPKDKQGFIDLGFDEKLIAAKRFEKYKWGTKTSNTRPNVNFQLIKSFNIDRKQKEFISTLFSVTYSRSFSFVTGERNSYDNPNYDLDPSIPTYFPRQRLKATDSIYNDEVIWAILGNVSIKINNRNNISWKNNLSVNTDNRLVRRFGIGDFADEPTTTFRTTFSQFVSDKIYSSQLLGDHQIGKYKTKVNWQASYSTVSRIMPNQLLSIEGALSSGGSAGRGASGGMVSTNSQENLKNGKLDITQPYTFLKNNQNFIKIGVGYQIRERDFGVRDLNFITYDGSTYERDNGVFKLPDDQRFLGQYLGLMANGKAGISVQDGSIPSSAYVASSTNMHAYIMNDQRFFKKLRAIYGVRLENFSQKLVSARRGLEDVNVNSKKLDILPSVNVVYSLTAKTNLRASYSETLNRPEFRELASFGFLEFVSNLFVFGDRKLTRAKIHNYDFRYEIYPGKSQLLSASVFYKKFVNPIEFIVDPIFPNQASYTNQSSSTLFGIEAEFRVLLSTIFSRDNENGLLSKFTFTGNGAYMKSKVLLGKLPDGRDFSRPLQGQSPYIVNGSLGYNDDKTGLSSTISVNRIGERLVLGGSRVVPDIYDKERTVIDLQLAKFFYDNKVELKFNVRDLLAQRFATYFDYDKSRNFTEKDRIFNAQNAPRFFLFSVTCKF